MGHLLRDCKDKQFRGALQEATNQNDGESIAINYS